MKPKSFRDEAKIEMETRTITLFEIPKVPNAENLRSSIDERLQSIFGSSLATMQRSWTVVTDGASVMVWMAGSSVSGNIAALNEKWMGCLVHVLNNAMKSSIQVCARHASLFRVNDDLMSLRKILEGSKRAEWNNYFTDGYKLKQAVKTRFGTQYIVVERFLMSAEKVWTLIINHDRKSALAQYNGLLKITDGDSLASFTALEAITYAFEEVYSTSVRFQASKKPQFIWHS